MELLYVVLALALVVGAYFLLSRKKEEPALPPREQPAPSKQKPERAAAPAKAESVKSPVAAPVAADEGERAAEARPSNRPPPPSRKDLAAKATERASTPPKAREVSSLRRGLAKSREAEGFFGRLRALFSGKKELSPDLAAQIEDVL